MGLANSASTSSIHVRIIGAGPVRLFLANECERRSLRWRLIEQRPRQSEHSKALAVATGTSTSLCAVAAASAAGSCCSSVQTTSPRQRLKPGIWPTTIAMSSNCVVARRQGSRLFVRTATRPTRRTAALESVREVLERQVVGST
jgi:hypothetical protein